MDRLERAIGRIEGKLDMLIALSEKNDARIGAVEKKLWTFSGIWAVCVFIASKLPLPLLPR
jgi:hypothetical protein